VALKKKKVSVRGRGRGQRSCPWGSAEGTITSRKESSRYSNPRLKAGGNEGERETELPGGGKEKFVVTAGEKYEKKKGRGKRLWGGQKWGRRNGQAIPENSKPEGEPFGCGKKSERGKASPVDSPLEMKKR